MKLPDKFQFVEQNSVECWCDLGATLYRAILTIFTISNGVAKTRRDNQKVPTRSFVWHPSSWWMPSLFQLYKKVILMWLLAAAVTLIFYFVLAYFETANIIPGTLSVTTSFVAVYLTFRRSPYFALAYAANDIFLIILWVMASIYDTRYISVVVCFAAFLANDIYGYISWQRMKERQKEGL